MSIPRHRLVIAAVALVLLAVATAVAIGQLRSGEDATRVETAVALAPDDTVRFVWTDWAGVRGELDGAVSAESTSAEVEEFLAAGFDADLTSTSALVTSAATMHDRLALSPASLDWELLAQSESRALLFLGLPDAAAADRLRDALRSAGYAEPEDQGGVWSASAEVFSELGDLTPELRHVRIDDDRGLAVTSDEAVALDDWAEERRGEDADDGVREVAGHLGGALSALLETGDHACVTKSLTQAGDADRERATQLVEQAGGISPYRGFGMAAFPGGSVQVTLAFETEDQARENADARARLAAGPAPGQGGTFPDRFELGDVTADGTAVTLDLAPHPHSYVLSDLSSGPVLFATC